MIRQLTYDIMISTINCITDNDEEKDDNLSWCSSSVKAISPGYIKWHLSSRTSTPVLQSFSRFRKIVLAAQFLASCAYPSSITWKHRGTPDKDRIGINTYFKSYYGHEAAKQYQ